MQEEAGARSKHGCRMNAIFSFLLLPVVLLLRAKEQEALHHPDRRRKRREEARKRDCDGGIKGYPSLSVTSFIVPCSVLPAHPSSAVTHFHTHQRHTSSPPGFTHSRPARTTLSGSLSQQPRPTAAARKPRKQRAGLSARIHTITITSACERARTFQKVRRTASGTRTVQDTRTPTLLVLGHTG